jgi:hypothetical protein
LSIPASQQGAKPLSAIASRPGRWNAFRASSIAVLRLASVAHCWVAFLSHWLVSGAVRPMPWPKPCHIGLLRRRRIRKDAGSPERPELRRPSAPPSPRHFSRDTRPPRRWLVSSLVRRPPPRGTPREQVETHFAHFKSFLPRSRYTRDSTTASAEKRHGRLMATTRLARTELWCPCSAAEGGLTAGQCQVTRSGSAPGPN